MVAATTRATTRARATLVSVLATAALAAGMLPAAAITPAPDDLPQDPKVDVTEQVVDLTFPVADPDREAHYIDDFLYLRGNGSRLHAATDIMAPKHRPVHAAVGGVVSFAPYPEPHYGWMINIQGDDGRRYSYVHLNNDTPERDGSGAWLDDDAGGVEHAYAPPIADAVKAKGSSLHTGDGVRVERGELIGWVGDSGNAKGVAPHLHFEIHVTGPDDTEHRINPYHSLVAAEERGDVPGSVTPMSSGSGGSGGSDDGGDADDGGDGDDGGDADDGGDGDERRRFSDVAPGDTHASSIERLAEAGIVEPCADGRYCPTEAIGRGDLAAALTAALDLEASQPPRFTDVDASHPRAEAIAAVDEHGILRGYIDDRYGPDRPLTRAQLATVLVRAFEVPSATAAVADFRFADVGDDDTHAANIYATYEAGLTTGCRDGTVYCGARDVTRAQIASFIDRQLRGD